jgi:molecular chaperone DnaK
MAADRIEGSNPDEAHRMNQMHEKIVSYFREGNKEKAFELMQEAIQIRDQYGTGGFNLDASVHLRR